MAEKLEENVLYEVTVGKNEEIQYKRIVPISELKFSSGISDILSNLDFIRKSLIPKYLPEKYIINEHICVCIWEDGSKTFSRRKETDNFDKELGFLFCCYQHYYRHLSRNKRSKILDWINYSSMKDFLFEIFKEKNHFTPNEARKYLENLEVEKKKLKVQKVEVDKINDMKKMYQCERKPKHAMED